MIANDKIGLYGKGLADVGKARADAKKAADMPKEFQQDQTFNCIVQPKPNPQTQ